MQLVNGLSGGGKGAGMQSPASRCSYNAKTTKPSKGFAPCPQHKTRHKPAVRQLRTQSFVPCAATSPFPDLGHVSSQPHCVPTIISVFLIAQWGRGLMYGEKALGNPDKAHYGSAKYSRLLLLPGSPGNFFDLTWCKDISFQG